MTFNTEKKVRLQNAIIGWIAIKRRVAKEEEKMQLVGGSSSTSSTPFSPATAAIHMQHKLPKVLQFGHFFASTTVKQLKNEQLPNVTYRNQVRAWLIEFFSLAYRICLKNVRLRINHCQAVEK